MRLKQSKVFLIFLLIASASCFRTGTSGYSPQMESTEPIILTPTSNILSTITSTPVSVQLPTLLEQNHQSQIIQLLKTNSGCDLPCWWGIQPGITTWIEASRIIENLDGHSNSISSISAPDASIVHSIGGFDLGKFQVYNRVAIGELENMVQVIYIESFTTDNLDGFYNYWSNYSPNVLFTKYGSPDRVWLETSCCNRESESPSNGYSLWMFYDKLNFLIVLKGVMEYKDAYYICPNFNDHRQITGIELYLVNPSQKIALEKYANIILERNILPIEEMTNLNVSEFYELLLPNNACFEAYSQ